MSTRMHMTCPPAQTVWAPAQMYLGTSLIMSVCDLPKTPSPMSPPKGGSWAGGGKVSITVRLGKSKKRDLPNTCPISDMQPIASGSTQANGTPAHVIRRGNQLHALGALLCLLPYASMGICSNLDNRAHGLCHASAVHRALTPPQSADWYALSPPVRFFPTNQPQALYGEVLPN